MSQTPEPKKTPRTPPYLFGPLLTLAVGSVYLDNVAREAAADRPKASAEAWTTHSAYRKDLFTRTLDVWVRDSGYNPADFPFSQDGVAREYLRYRKRSFDEAAAMKRQAEIEWAEFRASL